MENKHLQQSEYDQFRSFLEQQCGIVLGDNKLYLVKSRLAPLMARFSVESLSQLVKLSTRTKSKDRAREKKEREEENEKRVSQN